MTTNHYLFFDLPVGEWLRAGLDVGDIRIAVPGRLGRLFPHFIVLPSRSLLLTTFDQGFLALTLRGGRSCVSSHSEHSAYTRSLPRQSSRAAGLSGRGRAC